MIRLYKFHSQLILKDYSFFSIGKGEPYINQPQTEKLFNSYKSGIKLLRTLIEQSSKNEPLSLLLSGPFINCIEKKLPSLISEIKTKLANKEIVLFASTYHLSMSSLYSNRIFTEDIIGHQSQLKRVFDYKANIIYNPASIYFDELADLYAKLGFEYALAPSSQWHLNTRSPKQVFKSKNPLLKIILTGSSSNNENDGVIELIDGLSNILPSQNTSSMRTLLDSAPNESYLAPYAIHDKTEVQYITRNPLQSSIIDKILSLENRILELKKDELISELSYFTSIDYFILLKNSETKGKRPHDYYMSIMNMLSDFEIVHGLSSI